MNMSRNWKMQPADVLGMGPVVPVMVLQKLEQAVPLARALSRGGISVLEITLRTPVAMEAIRRIAAEVSGVIVGAGTVTSSKEPDEVAETGAVFAISPGLTPELPQAANVCPIALIPGISTGSEPMTGMNRGCDHFKFFPAEAAGGIKMLQAIAGPFPQVTFCPTGGITPANYQNYLKLNNMACMGGSWVAPQEMIDQGDWSGISALARKAVEQSGR
jgi:2-dehydro-3-deoxyphosphogluconate aldolase / (4S)-4-hydroxy-2-oxoglutarate aldolase